MFALENRLYFRNSGDLYVSDGTEAGTKRVFDLVPNLPDNVDDFTRVNSLLYFTAGNSTIGDGIYRTDGTTVTSIESVPRGNIFGLQLVGNNLFFNSNNSLWKLDTTNDTAAQVAFADAYFLTELNGSLIFVDSLGLWKSNGTEAGTTLIESVEYPHNLFNHQGILYFAAGTTSSIDGVELWRSDGTAQGTFLLKDIDPDFDYFGSGESSNPGNFTNFNGQLVFTTQNTVSGLWTTDGTAAGTLPILSGQIGTPQVSGNQLWIVRSEVVPPKKQVIRYTSGVSRPVVVDPPGVDQGSSEPGPAVELNGRYYLFADDGVPVVNCFG